jgi:Domain of unknown function (DUF4386)
MEEPVHNGVARIGGWAGWLAVLGIVGYHVALMLLAGQRVSGTADLGAIRAFYDQSAVAVLGISQFIVVVPVLVFFVALRQVADPSPVGRLLTTVAVLAGAAEVAIILTETALQMALVTAVAASEPVGGLFRLWDALYNSGAYVLEATWVLAFGLAIRRQAGVPRFLAWWTPLTGLLLALNVLAIWVGIPDAATLPSAIAISVWMAGAATGLLRSARADAALQPVAGFANAG